MCVDCLRFVQLLKVGVQALHSICVKHLELIYTLAQRRCDMC
ncbi:hypothetical protein HanIR_Chr08g0366201 [Helianthus annuus]|nr:hypothetical protein HanIR_Chr08g0366201 [Helianthus annuus]